MQLTPRNLIAVIALAVSCTSANAHHGLAADVDLGNYVDLSGTIELVEWINPHVVVHLSTEDENGFNQTWLIQADSPNTLLRAGVNRASFATMNRVQMRVYPSVSTPCSNACYGYGYEFSAVNGNTYILHQRMYELVHELTLEPD